MHKMFSLHVHRKGTRAYLLPLNHGVVYECLVDYVSQLSVVLMISEEAHHARYINMLLVILLVRGTAYYSSYRISENVRW